MTALIPNRLLFQFEFPLRYRVKPPAWDGTLKAWNPAERLPDFGALDGQRAFADVFACWSEAGLTFACRVEGKRNPPQCERSRFWTGDNIRVCTDVRDARANRRATRFCRQFYLLPTGGGRNGREPVGGVNPIPRSREAAPAVPAGRIEVAARILSGGYSLQAFLPADCLSGFDPAEYPRIGFYYIVEDLELGQQYLTVGDDLNWHFDPSTWATAVLVR